MDTPDVLAVVGFSVSGALAIGIGAMMKDKPDTPTLGVTITVLLMYACVVMFSNCDVRPVPLWMVHALVGYLVAYCTDPPRHIRLVVYIFVSCAFPSAAVPFVQNTTLVDAIIVLVVGAVVMLPVEWSGDMRVSATAVRTYLSAVTPQCITHVAKAVWPTLTSSQCVPLCACGYLLLLLTIAHQQTSSADQAVDPDANPSSGLSTQPRDLEGGRAVVMFPTQIKPRPAPAAVPDGKHPASTPQPATRTKRTKARFPMRRIIRRNLTRLPSGQT